MWYVIVGTDVADSLPLRKELRPAHLARIEKLNDMGRVLAAGPMPIDDTDQANEAGFSGSVMIVDFPSLEQARIWANDDPYNTGGVFDSVSVKPFIKVLP